MKYSIEERKSRARSQRAEGYNCAQCVVMAFDDILSPSRVEAGALAAQGLGSGFGGQGYVCGALSGATLTLGLLGESPRPALYKKVSKIFADFASLEGVVNCSDLKKPGRKPCIDLITDAVEILHRHLESADE